MKTRILLALVMLTASACTMDLGLEGLGDPTQCGFLFDSHPCVVLAVDAPMQDLLKGDTMRVTTRSDSGQASPVAWSIAGAAELVEGTEADVPSFPDTASSVLIRGLTPGYATITATHAEPQRSASVTVTIADSSVIAHIYLYAYASQGLGTGTMTPTATMHVGDSLWVSANLSDAVGRQYGALPERWTISDSGVATLSLHPAGHGLRPGVWVRGRAAGGAEVVAAFLSVRTTLQFNVVP